MDDILKGLMDAGFKPVENDDMGTFEPITGKYVCTIKEAGRKEGTSKKTSQPYAFRAMKLVVAEVIEGDKAINRHLDLSYNLDAEGTKRLLNDLFTAGIQVTAKNDQELDALLESSKDKTLNIRCWVWTPDKTKDGEPIAEADRKGRQQIKIVKDFSKSKGKGTKGKTEVPF